MRSLSADHVVRIQLRLALMSLVLAVLGGALGVLHYIPELSPVLHKLGLTFQKLRPLHTTFASTWIFACSIAVIYHYLGSREGGLSSKDVLRFRLHTACWVAAGLGILVSLGVGVYSGREYIGFHPVFSALLLAGWLAFAFNFLRRLRHGFWNQPVYVYLWTIGILYFIYTFAEGHAHYFLSSLRIHPVRDLAVQWKSCGTLVGSFNFLVYGSLMYVSEKLTADRRYAQSKLAFMLFGVGCLNSFTNFAHHTYHLPQSHTVKWIAFVVSMLESIILLRLLVDIGATLRRGRDPKAYDAALGFLTSAKCWAAVMVFQGVLMAVPSLNSLIHGTFVVMGHAMGAELGIDSMVLFGCITFLLTQLHAKDQEVQARLNHPRVRRQTVLLNVSLAVLAAWLTISGASIGFYRYLGEAPPIWTTYGWLVFPLAGGMVGVSILGLVWPWLPLLSGTGLIGSGLAEDARGEVRNPRRPASARDLVCEGHKSGRLEKPSPLDKEVAGRTWDGRQVKLRVKKDVSGQGHGTKGRSPGSSEVLPHRRGHRPCH